MKKHLDREILRQFVSNELPSEEARLVEQHLSICLDCRDLADEVSAWIALQLLDSWLRPSYDEAFERAADGAAQRLSVILGESREAEDLLTELLKEPLPLRRYRVQTEEKFQTLKLCQLLRSRSQDVWFSDPAAALEWADLAVEVARHLSRGRYGSTLVDDSLALSWAYMGNAFRITSDLRRAEQALHQAGLYHLAADEDAFTQMEILSFYSSLRTTQGRYEEAIALSDLVITTCRESQDHHLEGSALIQKGLGVQRSGRAKEAIPIISSGLGLIDPDQDSRLLLMGEHNLVWALTYSGDPCAARCLLEQNRSLYSETGDPLVLARFQWLTGEVARDLGHLSEAAVWMRNASELFLEYNVGIDFFSVSLDLAQVYALGEQRRQVKELLSEIIPLGEALGIGDEVLQARLLYSRVSA